MVVEYGREVEMGSPIVVCVCSIEDNEGESCGCEDVGWPDDEFRRGAVIEGGKILLEEEEDPEELEEARLAPPSEQRRPDGRDEL